MVFGLVMLWVGVALGFFLAAMFGVGGGTRRAGDLPEGEPGETVVHFLGRDGR